MKNRSANSLPPESRPRRTALVVSSDGYLLTRAHLVSNARHVTALVTFPAVSADAGRTRKYTARIVGVDRRNDLALLKIDAAGLPFFDLNAAG